MLAEVPLLVLCDLEGVLLDIPDDSTHHRHAYQAAIKRTVGLNVDIDEVRDGHTDYTLVCDALSSWGLDDVINADDYARICDVALDEYLKTCPSKLDQFLRPGVWSTLLLLKAMPSVTTAPCSGYAPPIAQAILERSFLTEPMRVMFSSFAEYGCTRPDIIEQARRRAGDEFVPWPVEQTVLVSRCAPDLVAVHTIAVDCPSATAHTHIKDFEQLPAVLEKLHLR
jgi:beta-phosphoglucomutase-like phosphatase (HAD superfamily)